jgi:hypothetical protein
MADFTYGTHVVVSHSENNLSHKPLTQNLQATYSGRMMRNPPQCSGLGQETGYSY